MGQNDCRRSNGASKRFGGTRQHRRTPIVPVLGSNPGQRLQAGCGTARIVDDVGQLKGVREQFSRTVWPTVSPPTNSQRPQGIFAVDRFTMGFSGGKRLLLPRSTRPISPRNSCAHPSSIIAATRRVGSSTALSACSNCVQRPLQPVACLGERPWGDAEWMGGAQRPNLLVMQTNPFRRSSDRMERHWLAALCRRQCRDGGRLARRGPISMPGRLVSSRRAPCCRIHALWPKRDGSLIELLRRSCTSNCHGRPTIN
jgi:hypothetical protein